MVCTQKRGLHTFSHDTALINLFSTTKVYTFACGRTCDMGRRERERKAAARTCHSLDAFFSPKKRKTGMYLKFITFQKVTGPTPNHLLWYQHTPDLHPGIAKAGGGAGGFSCTRPSATALTAASNISTSRFYGWQRRWELSRVSLAQ